MAQWKSRLNHDWLKNHFLIALGQIRNVLAGLVENDTADADLRAILDEWDERFVEVHMLVDACEQRLLPETLFSFPPLLYCRAEHREWMLPWIKADWNARFPTRQWIADARLSLFQTDRLVRLMRRMHAYCGERPAMALRLAEMLQKSATRLSSCLTQLPTTIF